MQNSMVQGLYGKQVQSQKMLAHQIMAIKMLSLKSVDLREEILKEVENNPALEITFDPMTNEKSGFKTQNDSDAYQKILENQEDSRETLQEHLLSQLNMTKLSPEETEACRQLIFNLDQKGFFILAPDSLKSEKGKRFSPTILQKAIKIVQNFDPAGICVKNFEESLKVQAEIKLNEEENENLKSNKLILFILDGHFSFLDPPEPEKIRQKIVNWIKQNSEQKIKNEDQTQILKSYENFSEEYITEKKILGALSFIKKLNPFPASNFLSSAQNAFIKPDVSVTFEKGFLEKDDLQKGEIAFSKEEYIKVTPLNDTLPEVALSKDFSESLKSKKITNKSVEKMIKEKISSANFFINILAFRNQITFETLVKIVSIQKDFFKFGQGHLVPLTQKKLSQMQNISESTISRMADSKYILCDLGLYPMKNFFSHSLHKNSNISSDAIKLKIQKLIENQNENEKKLSDQKICEILEKEGLKIARRTVAKYRSQLNLLSSFKR